MKSNSVKIWVTALISLIGVAPCSFSFTTSIDAIDSTSRYVGSEQYWWDSDIIAVQSSYASSDGHLSVSHGYVKFDLSSIPNDAVINSLTLTATVEDIRHDGPDENPPPSISVFRVANDNWSREGNTHILLDERLTEGQLTYTSWSLNIDAVDWSTDLVDNVLSLAFHNETIPMYHPNSYIYNWVFLYGSDTFQRPTLIINYIPEPATLFLLVLGAVMLRKRISVD